MSKQFETMTREEQVALATAISDIAAQNGLVGVKPEFYTEMVCALGAQKSVAGRKLMRASKEFPSTEAEKVKAFNEAVKEVTKDVEGCTVSVTCQMGAGDMYETIENVMPFEGDEKCSIVHNKGEVVLIDFWATWCPPCQKPMAHNQEMLEKRKDDWAGKVRIVGLSIDQTKDKMVSHVNDKKWTSVEHYHRHESQCSDTYGVNGVPHVLLLDTEGRIVFKGHPATRKDLEADFDTLLKGERITGEGAWVDAAPKEEGDEPAKPEELEEGFKRDYDPVACQATIDEFKALGQEWIADEEFKKNTEGMTRCFCVMTLEEEYDAKTQSMIGRFYNHRVLVGPKEKIDALKAVFDEKVKGNFEIKLQEHPM